MDAALYRIIYVDDEPGLLEITKVFLEKSGQISVDTHTSAKTALPMVTSGTYDAVISDYQMPGMDGIHFLKKVRESGNSIPFILFTGKGREEVVIEAINNGADFYLQKGGDPVSQFAELATKIRFAINSRRAEEALVQEKSFMDAIFNSVPGMLYLYDAEGNLIRWNKKHEVMTGYSPDELSRMHLLDWFKGNEKSQKAVLDGVKTTMETGFGEAEADLQRKDGTAIPMYFTASPLTLHGKQYFAGLGIDITDRRKAADALRASEEMYRRIVETSIEGIWSMNAEFTTVFINPKMGDMLGYTVEEMLGKKIMEFMDPAELGDNETKLEKRRKGIGESYERKFRKKDGTLRWFAVSATALKTPDGSFGGSFAMLTDITDKKLAEDELKRKNEELGAAYEQLAASEEELRQNMDELAVREHEARESQQKYRDLFDNAILGIFRSTADGRYLDMNMAFARIAGFNSPHEMMESVKNIVSLYVHPEDRERLKAVIAADGEIHNFEVEIHHTSGNTIWIAINAKACRNSSGTILWYDGTIEDITIRRNAEQALSDQNHEKRPF